VVVKTGVFASFVQEFFSNGGCGLNVTVPFKEEAFRLTQIHSERATLAGAVNTLTPVFNGKLHGDNTDSKGLIVDITRNYNVAIKNKNVIILGAGGAVRGALAGLTEAKPKQILLLNRTVARAAQLQQEFADYLPIAIGEYSSTPSEPIDLIINGTSMGLTNEVPPISADLISEDTFCYDMMYGAEDTAFVKWAKSNGATTAVDGLGMLVEQAAESFYIWCNVRPETKSVLTRLKNLS
jgi:shikimate dehydrogenase